MPPVCMPVRIVLQFDFVLIILAAFDSISCVCGTHSAETVRFDSCVSYFTEMKFNAIADVIRGEGKICIWRRVQGVLDKVSCIHPDMKQHFIWTKSACLVSTYISYGKQISWTKHVVFQWNSLALQENLHIDRININHFLLSADIVIILQTRRH